MKKIVKYDFECKICGLKIFKQQSNGTFIECNCTKPKFVDVSSLYCRHNIDKDSSAILILYMEDGSIVKIPQK